MNRPTARSFSSQVSTATHYTSTPRLSILWDQIKSDAAAYGLYVQPAPTATPEPSHPLPAPQRQSGAFRINCVDCLDRTNVVQGVLGRDALEGVLRAFGVLAAGEKLPTTLPQVRVLVRVCVMHMCVSDLCCPQPADQPKPTDTNS